MDYSYYSDDESVLALIEVIGFARDFDLIFRFQKAEIERLKYEYVKLKKEIENNVHEG